MNKKRTLKSVVAKFTIAAVICSIVIGLIVGLFVCLGMCWEFSINTWLEIAEAPNRIALWQCMLISIVPGFGQLSVFVAVLTWIATLFLN